LSQERIRHLHAVGAASPRPRDASAALCSVYLLVICWHVRRIKHENINRVPEAARQRTREWRDERIHWDLHEQYDTHKAAKNFKF
jgi:hypothetical protein